MHVYFYVIDDSPDEGMMPYYQHEVVSLAEGYSKMGIECWGNVDYWITHFSEDKPCYLIRKAPIEYAKEAKVIFIGADYPLSVTVGGRQIPSKPISHHNATPMVYVARAQTQNTHVLQTQFLRQFDLVLLCDYNKAYTYPSHVRPWVFGLTKRIIDATTQPLPWEKRSKSVIWNFRCMHSSRALAEVRIKPILEKHFFVDTTHDSIDETFSDIETLHVQQTNWRHYPSYYKKLCSHMVCAAFGGWFDIALWGYHYSLINRIGSKLLRMFSLPSSVLRQHDSWRMWEAWAAGSVMLCADLEKCNVQWPVMPQNYVHYLGVTPTEFLFPHSFEKKLEAARLKDIAHSGREFVLTHYTPQACAIRAFEYLGI